MAFSVSYIYEVIDRYTRPLNKINKANKRVAASAKRAGQATKKFSDKMLSTSTVVSGAAGIIGGASVLNTFTNFESSMNKLGAVTLANEEQFQKFRDVAKDLGATTQFSASQAAQGMTFLAMAGLDANKVMEAIPGTLKLAAAGGIELATAADIATNVLAQMGLEVKDLSRVNDVLSLVQARANTDIIQAAEAMKNVGTSASSLGVSLEETTALIGAMANAGVKGGEAGTLLRNSLMKVVNPSAKARKTLRSLRIDLKEFTTPEGKIKNFTTLLKQLEDRGATTAQIFNIFEERGGRAIQALAKSGKPAIDGLTEALKNAGGSADKMQKIQLRGLPGVLKALASAWEAVQIAVVESGLDEIIGSVATSFANFFRWLSKTSPTLLKIVGIVGALVVIMAPLMLMVGTFAALAAPMLTALGGIAAAFAIITGPIGLVVLGITALIAGVIFLIDNWSKVKDFFGIGGDSVATIAGAKNTLDGQIEVTGTGGASASWAEFNTDMPGNLGANMAGA